MIEVGEVTGLDMVFTPNGKALTTFRLVVTGTPEEPDWRFIKVVAWEQLAESLAQNLVDGDKVKVFGNEKTRWWTTPEGEKRSEQQFTTYRVQLLK